MCGRYGRTSDREAVMDYFDIEEAPDFFPSYNVAPQTFQPVVRLDAEGGRELRLMRWGLVPFWAKEAKAGYATFNARAEEITGKPAFREAVKRRRCLVPADNFYEWQKLGPKEKQPFAIGLKNGEPCAFAGIWETWKHEEELLETFSVITTDANALMEPIHTRMPVILKPSDYARWLQPAEPSHLPVDLLRPYDAEAMRAWPVSARVGNVRNNDHALLDPMTSESSASGLNSK